MVAYSKRPAAQDDIRRQARRQRQGLEAMPVEGKQLTFGDLIDWWWKNYGVRLRSTSVQLVVEKHFRKSLGLLPLIDVTTARLEALLNEKAVAHGPDTRALSPKTLNTLRGLVHRMFSHRPN